MIKPVHVRFLAVPILIATCLLIPRPGFARQLRSVEMTEQMLALDSRMEQTINELVGILSSVEDSPETDTQVSRLKTDAIKGLKKSLDTYQRERQLRLGELQRRYANLPAESLAAQIEKMDEKIDERITQITQISESFARDQDLEKYEYVLKEKAGYDDEYKLRRVKSEAYTQNRRTAARGDQNRQHVIEGLEDMNRRLELETGTLERNLAAASGERRAALEKQIAGNREIMARNQVRIEELQDVYAADPARQLSRDEVQDLEKEIREKVTGLKQMHRDLVRLKAERDQALIREKAARTPR